MNSIRAGCLIYTMIAAISFILFSCVATQQKCSYTLNEKYKSVNLSNRTLIVVFPTDRHILICNRDDVADDYGGVNASPESRIRKFYFPEMFVAFKSMISGDSIYLFDQYCPDIEWDTMCRNDITLKTGSDSIPVSYLLPEKSNMQANSLDSSVMIIFEAFEFKRNKFQIEYYWDDRSRKPANLEVTAKVLIWDYTADRAVFYGKVSDKTEFQFGLQRKHWDESAHDLVKNIVLLAKCL